MFSLIIPTIIVEGKGAFGSLGRSRKLVSNRWLKTLALLIIIGIIVSIVGIVGSALAIHFSTVHPIINPLITSVISAFASPICPITITYFYYAMIAREILPPPPPMS